MSLVDLTSIAAVKLYAGIEGDNDDPVIGKLITACSAWVRTWLNRDITTASYAIRRSGRGTTAIQTPQYPIQSVALLQIDGVTIPAQQSWGQAGYYFDDTQIALCGYCFTRGVSNVRIQYTAGYATPPADIAQAVNELVTLRYKMRDKMEWSSKGLANETVSLVQKDMPSSVATLLRNQRCITPL